MGGAQNGKSCDFSLVTSPYDVINNILSSISS